MSFDHASRQGRQSRPGDLAQTKSVNLGAEGRHLSTFHTPWEVNLCFSINE